MKKKSVPVVRCGVLVLSAALITVGLLRQEHVEVMEKAVRICLECIGIG